MAFDMSDSNVGDRLGLETIIYTKRDHVAYVTLNRPQRGNALSVQLIDELGKVWADYRDDPQVWVAILTGAGERFCVGADVKDIVDNAARGQGQRFQIGHRRFTDAKTTAKQVGCYKPVISAVNGVAAGGGLHLVADADIAIASENAWFVDSHVSSGHVSGLDVIVLGRRIPAQVAIRMAILGNQERMTARRAYEVGLVTEVVPPEQLMAAAEATAEKILRNSPTAVRRTIEAYWRGMELGLSGAMEEGYWLIQEQWTSNEFLEGNRAFAEKRKPEWTNT
jgi:enoyl-CoA hydratase/carnithine racemase